ncbi:hypothetical protein EDD85DRAFT_789609 [Armillaria nabsnona]|nr:hypothetical protein EDD85DRAFT_789609 [Armillaria nabsnona]
MAYAIKPSGPSIPENSLEPLPTGNYGLYRDVEFFETASNAAFLHKDLIPVFLDNTFSVDVDIRSSSRFSLSQYGARSKTSPVPSPSYRQRGARRLVPQRTFSDLSQTLELAPMTDHRWPTVLGKSIWETVLETRMAARYVPSDNSDEENEADPLDT